MLRFSFATALALPSYEHTKGLLSLSAHFSTPATSQLAILRWCESETSITRSLVAWSPAGLDPMKDEGTETASDWTSASISEKVNIS